jgi:hypothetical protein
MYAPARRRRHHGQEPDDPERRRGGLRRAQEHRGGNLRSAVRGRKAKLSGGGRDAHRRCGRARCDEGALDSFRAEINAAYNAVVMRCKTHMHCLEVQNYDEAKCYMAASDRKDAERRFSDLSEDLRRIEKKKQGKSPKPKSAPPVTVTTTVNQGAVQTQSNTAQTGDTIEDQDVLVMCGNAKNLLNARCRQPCRERCD